MSRTLARQKLEAAIGAMRCARSNIDAACEQLNDYDHEARLGLAALNLLSLSVEEFIKGAREAADAIGGIGALDAN